MGLLHGEGIWWNNDHIILKLEYRDQTAPPGLPTVYAVGSQFKFEPYP